jgi:hypothetical protein
VVCVSADTGRVAQPKIEVTLITGLTDSIPIRQGADPYGEFEAFLKGTSSAIGGEWVMSVDDDTWIARAHIVRARLRIPSPS